jgi:Leucine-rich repeat (LRR) protein
MNSAFPSTTSRVGPRWSLEPSNLNTIRRKASEFRKPSATWSISPRSGLSREAYRACRTPKLKELEQLKLGGNRLTSLPPGLWELTKLKLLTLWSNELTEVPEGIGNLRNLEGLDLSGNDLSRLPESIANLQKLKRFYMSDTKNIVLTQRQMAWIVELLRNGSSVYVDKFLKDQITAQFPEVAGLNRNWFIGEEEFEEAVPVWWGEYRKREK